MAVTPSEGPVVLLRMVRLERLQEDAVLLQRVRERFGGREVLWATTASGAALLRTLPEVTVLVLAEAGLSPGNLRAALSRLREVAPARCVVAYDTPARTGNLLLEVLALSARVRELWWTADGEGLAPLRTGALAGRVALGLLAAGLAGCAGLLGGVLVGVLLPVLAACCRPWARRLS